MAISILRRATHGVAHEGASLSVLSLESDAYQGEVGDFPPSLHRMLSVLTDGVVVIDGGGVVRHVNDDLIHLAVQSYDDLIGQPAKHLFPNWDRYSGSPSGRVDRGPPRPWGDRCAPATSLWRWPQDRRPGRDLALRVRRRTLGRRAGARRSAHQRRRATSRRDRTALSPGLRGQHGADDRDRPRRSDHRGQRGLLRDGGIRQRGSHRTRLEGLHLPRRHRDYRGVASPGHLRGDRAVALHQALPAQGRQGHLRRGAAFGGP